MGVNRISTEVQLMLLDHSGMQEETLDLKIQRLRAFVTADISELGRAVQSLLLAHDFGASMIGAERDVLEIYADACGATYGDPEIGDAIHSLLRVVDREGVCLGKVSVARERAVDGSRDAVRVDLRVIQQSCEEAIASRSRDGSIPRVVISADVLLAVVSFAQELSRESVPASASELSKLIRFAMRGPVVGGSGAADAWGEVVKPFTTEVTQRPSAAMEGNRIEGLVHVIDQSDQPHGSDAR
jgi:hypothetical protein